MTALAPVAALLAALAVVLWPRHGGRGAGDALSGEGSEDGRGGRASRSGREPAGAVLRRRVPGVLGSGRVRGSPDGDEWVADLAEVVAVGLRAGLDLPSAVRAAAAAPSVTTAAPWLGRALEGPDGDVLVSTAVTDRPPDARGGGALDVLARAWRLSERTGASAAHTTAAAAEAVRGRSAARHRLQVALAGPRASMRLLSLLPVVGPAAALVLGLDPARLYGPAPARVAVGCGIALTALGWWWSRTLVTRACRAGTTHG